MELISTGQIAKGSPNGSFLERTENGSKLMLMLMVVSVVMNELLPVGLSMGGFHLGNVVGLMITLWHGRLEFLAPLNRFCVSWASLADLMWRNSGYTMIHNKRPKQFNHKGRVAIDQAGKYDAPEVKASSPIQLCYLKCHLGHHSCNITTNWSIGFNWPELSLLCLNFAKTPEVAAHHDYNSLSFKVFQSGRLY
nr:probable anion transporter 3, chloroplastic [Ipomoea batatas]